MDRERNRGSSGSHQNAFKAGTFQDRKELDAGGVAVMPYSAISVADEILRVAKRHGKALTPLQLMKLVYIAHGFHLAVKETDLFPDRIEAWKYGPVIPDLYHATKQYGRNTIPLEKIDDASATNVDSDTSLFLQEVYDKYGHLTGIELSNLTHQSGTPWDQVYRDGIFGIEIPDDIIQNHYRRLLSVRQGATAT
jgi:uncharacterized phage-associated protein